MRSNRRWILVLPLAAGLTLALSGCTQLELHGFLPGFAAGQPPVTNHVTSISNLWVGAWIVLIIIGIIVWSLMIWASIAYRRRRGQTGLPVQLRYNMPIEIFYTAVPLILVLGMFAFTARDEDAIEKRTPHPDVTIAVFGKQWAWDFNYLKENVYVTGVQAKPVSDAPNTGFDNAALPQLVLPLGKTVELQLHTRDVDHSFWVIDFLYKKDLIAGQTNYEDFTPMRLGTYEGKCAELCGEYHSRMLFTVKVVTPAQYTAYIQHLRSIGNTGQLGESLDKDDSSGAAGSQDTGRPVGGETNRRGGNNTNGITGSGK